MTTYVLSDTAELYLDELCEWARANGLDPDMIPLDAPINVDRGRLTVREVVVDSDGKLVIVDNKLATTPRAVPLAKAPDPALWVKLD